VQRADPPHHARRRHRGHRRPVLSAVREILADGKPRTTEEIVADGRARGLLSQNRTLQDIAMAVHAYIGRKIIAGRKPFVVEDGNRHYRLNHPRDPWPDPQTPLPARRPSDAARAALELARRTSTGTDPSAFERAVCEVFSALGFVSTHLGGNPEPDGIIEAPLGPLGYRVVLECKSTPLNATVGLPNVEEPARYRKTHDAQAAALIGPAFGSEPTLISELHAHDVSAWTVDDLATAVEAAVNPLELRWAFTAGFAEDALGDVLWERSHGIRKRIAVIAEMLQQIAAREQRIALTASPSIAARLTVDSAMICVNESLARSGSEARCERADVLAAFDWMTQPLVGIAVWVEAARDAIVVTT
jgi:Restriction endonuclease